MQRMLNMALVVCFLQVYPVLGFPDAAIAQASERLLKDHQVKYNKNSRILQQVPTVFYSQF